MTEPIDNNPKGISQEDALLEVELMNANVQALFEASVENAKRK